jgi:hypothetical protein
VSRYESYCFKTKYLADIFNFHLVKKDSNKTDREEAERIACEYLRTDPSMRGIDLPIYKIKQENEPPIFTGFFAPWDASFWANKVDI